MMPPISLSHFIRHLRMDSSEARMFLILVVAACTTVFMYRDFVSRRLYDVNVRATVNGVAATDTRAMVDTGANANFIDPAVLATFIDLVDDLATYQVDARMIGASDKSTALQSACHLNLSIGGRHLGKHQFYELKSSGKGMTLGTPVFERLSVLNVSFAGHRSPASFPIVNGRPVARLVVGGRTLDAVLVDTGASHNFMSKRTAAELGLAVRDLNPSVLVETANGEYHSYEYGVADVAVAGRRYAAVKFVLSHVERTVLGLAFMKRHKSVAFLFGGPEPVLDVAYRSSGFLSPR